MIVLKFGGTSVGTPESLNNVKKIVESLSDDAIVVVSALGGLTDRMIATATKAASGDTSYKEDFEAMATRHYNIIDDVVSPEIAEETCNKLKPLLSELNNLYEGVSLISDLPDRTLAKIVSLGERMSSIIVADMIPAARHVNSLDIIKTEKYFDKNIAATELTDRLIKDTLSSGPYPVVMGGFISSDKDSGEITNLGRGGSDYTAALVAASLNADVLQIWTDVDGFLTTDPRIVSDARVIDEMSFVESMDLCTFGAKVVYPPTIYPVFHKNIPIRILNTHRPEAPGTLITDHPDIDSRRNKYIVGISALKNEALITLRGHIASDTSAVAGRAFNSLSLKGLSPHVVAGNNMLNTFSFAISDKEAEQAVRLLKEEFAPELVDSSLEVIEMISGLATVAVVGDNLKAAPTMTDRLKTDLENANIEILALTDKASETNISFVIYEKDVNEALRMLHNSIF